MTRRRDRRKKRNRRSKYRMRRILLDDLETEGIINNNKLPFN
jgi:hypothetical protein